MSDDWQRILRDARRQTDTDFASEAARLTHLTEAELREILPQSADQERFIELMSIVKDEARSEAQKADAIRRASGLLEVAVTVIARAV